MATLSRSGMLRSRACCDARVEGRARQPEYASVACSKTVQLRRVAAVLRAGGRTSASWYGLPLACTRSAGRPRGVAASDTQHESSAEAALRLPHASGACGAAAG